MYRTRPAFLFTSILCRGQLKRNGTCAETTFSLSAKRTNPFQLAGASVQSTTGSRGVHTSGSNAGYTMFRGSVKGTGCPVLSPVSPSLPHPCVTVCHHISTGVYLLAQRSLLKSEGRECPHSTRNLRISRPDLPTSRGFSFYVVVGI